MPSSETRTSTSSPRPVTLSRTVSPSSEYFTPFSTRFRTRLNSCVRTPVTGAVSWYSATMDTPRRSAIGSTLSTTSAATETRSTVVGLAASNSSMARRSSRSSTRSDTRRASVPIRPVRRFATSGSTSPSNASASRLIAPSGVFSSWLTLATKSRRTASTRIRSVMSSKRATAPRWTADGGRRSEVISAGTGRTTTSNTLGRGPGVRTCSRVASAPGLTASSRRSTMRRPSTPSSQESTRASAAAFRRTILPS